MFVLKQSSSYKWPVKLELPVDGGTFSRYTFDAEFKRLPESRIKDIGKAIDANEVTDIDMAREVLLGWQGIQDKDGNEFPFSEQNRETLLDISGVGKAVVISFFESLAGAKRKN